MSTPGPAGKLAPMDPLAHDDPSLRTVVERIGAVTVVAVTGELDIATAPDLEEALLGVLDGEPEAVVIDLTAVAFLGSSGLAVLTGFQQRADPAGVRLVADQHAVLHPLRLTRLDNVFPIFGTRSEAVQVR
ncbi:STAS domain-containing protein [Amycolatopsis magusensis]|uniref:STAS domain-containing protein n=1 Tax=Amycolatopsis magusensis TaxID=882444 RepID=UPI0037AFF47C